MELIPLLSTIVIVATVCTIILVIGAYTLYKIQEKKSDLFAGKKQQIQKVVSAKPEDFEGRKLQIKKPEVVPVFKNRYEPFNKSLSEKQKSDKTYQRSEKKKIKRVPTEPKYVKYSTKEFLQAAEEENSGVINWR